MRNGSRIVLIAIVGVMVAIAGTAIEAQAYGSYAGGCKGCHGSFTSGNPSLHDVHQDFVDSCRDCHDSIGDDPNTNSSGNYAEYSCNGCHRLEGLVTFHVRAERSCTPCHSNSQPVTNESTAPYYYQAGRSALSNPCRVQPANGGEDYTGDGQGLDNDGDGLYDGDDPDCEGQISTVEATWSTLKVLFDLD